MMSDEGEWKQRVKAAWERAATELEAQGYTRYDTNDLWSAVFIKGDSEKVLVRSLAKLNWHPIEREI